MSKNEFSEEQFYQSVWKNDSNFQKRFFKNFAALTYEQQKRYDFGRSLNDGSQLAHFAAWNNNSDLMNFLIDQNIKVDGPNDDGVTPLMIMCFQISKCSDLLDKVIEHTKNPNSADKKGFTIIHYAALNDNSCILQRLLTVPGIDIMKKTKTG